MTAGTRLAGADGRGTCFPRLPLERVQRPSVGTGTIMQLSPGGHILGAFLQLLNIQILKDSPEKLLLLAVVPEAEEKGGRHMNI